MSTDLTVNGRTVNVPVADDTPLLDVLRNHLDLKGSRYGCGLEQCGSCVVVIDGKAEYSCAREIASVAGKHVETVRHSHECQGVAGH
jgi:nicotinate dehydrogenase subunit A